MRPAPAPGSAPSASTPGKARSWRPAPTKPDLTEGLGLLDRELLLAEQLQNRKEGRHDQVARRRVAEESGKRGRPLLLEEGTELGQPLRDRERPRGQGSVGGGGVASLELDEQAREAVTGQA